MNAAIVKPFSRRESACAIAVAVMLWACSVAQFSLASIFVNYTKQKIAPLIATVRKRYVSLDLDTEFQRATLLRDSGDLPGARALLERLSKSHSTVFGIWLVLGGVQMSESDYQEAEKSLSVATALRPRSELASLSLFHTLKHLDRLNEAYAEMRRFLALRPESHEYDLLRQELQGDETT
jgi:predicted Zn-dependent protease